MHTRLSLTMAAAALLALAACSPDQTVATSGPQRGLRYKLNGPLIPARMTMTTAWDYPQNPLTDRTLDQSTLSKEIQLGYRLFTNTPAEAGRIVPGGMSCNNCHMNGGQRERSLPLVGISGVFPEYNRRAGRLISLNDRIVDCFLRSENATGALGVDAAGHTGAAADLPGPASREVLAIAAYLNWISRGQMIGKSPAWRGQNGIPQASLVPIAQLDSARGEALYKERCVSCHGPDGQGVFVGDRRPGPLWGPGSWNDGAGAARIYTLAGIIRYSMPYLDPGNMTDREALDLAAFITAQPRPAFPFKDRDYLVDPLPTDAVYYPPRPAAH